MINLPHPKSKKHPQMPIASRAFQFAPFAALTGYEDAIKEAARFTTERIELDEEAKKILDTKMKKIQKQISSRPSITFTYFVPDSKKQGGQYVTVTGIVRKIDFYRKLILLEDSRKIPLQDVIDISE